LVLYPQVGDILVWLRSVHSPTLPQYVVRGEVAVHSHYERGSVSVGCSAPANNKIP
jgi:hypothetical protein